MNIFSIGGRLAVLALSATLILSNAGCGGGGGGLFSGLGQGGGLGSRLASVPQGGSFFGGGSGGGFGGYSSPGAGRSKGFNTPRFAGPQAPYSTPPSLVNRPLPPAPMQFDSNTQEVLRKFNTTVTGDWATPDNVAVVVASLQLYQPRNHSLTINIGPDPNRRPLNGLWVGRGNSANIYLYNPQSRTTAPHEIAHDVTLWSHSGPGNNLKAILSNEWGYDQNFPRGYSRSNPKEAAADALSFWARRVSGLHPNLDYNPTRNVVSALQPMLADNLRGF